MAEQTLADILNDCINWLASGQTVEDCLRLYPNQAARLNPLLESGLVAARVGYPAGEVTLAQERIWQRIEQAYTAPQPVRPVRLPRLWITAAAIALLLASIVVAAQSSSPGDPLYGVRVFIEAIFSGGAAAPTATDSPSPAATETHTPTSAPTDTATDISTPTDTPSPAPTQTETPTLAPTAESVTGVIEGPVEAINGSVIVIYGIEIEIALDDPMLDVIQVGDVIRIEGSFGGEDSAIVVQDGTIVAVDVEVYVDEAGGGVWRDDGTCNHPPPDWAPAHGWRRRCEGGAPGGGNGSGSNPNNGRGMGNDD